ncbi:ABC transporter substrate-binding protein [bacterium]|nr:ABC transporter substrate-binding protein [bacterium]
MRLGALLALAAACGWILAGCGGSASGSREQAGGLNGSDLDQAQRLYSQLKREYALERDRKSLDLAGTLLDYYPNFSRNDEVLQLAVESAARLRDADRALGLTDELVARYPDSPLVDQALRRGAELAAGRGDTLRAAEYMLTWHDRDPERGLRSDGTPLAATYLAPLSHAQLSGLLAERPASSLWTYVGYLDVAAALEAGLAGEAGDTGARLQQAAPQDRWTVAALELLGTGGGAPRRLMMPIGEVDPDRVGVIVPLTGRYAVLGNAFYDAALMATRATNLEHGSAFELQLEDSAADPVTSALAARRLCAEEGSIAVLGGLLSDPTASAAVVCDMYGVPLVSPTATNDGIWKLGPGIFQTNITGLYEVRLLAELATTIMLKKRFAIIHPNTPEGLRHAQVFTTEITARGGEVVATAMFPPQGTDFKDPILDVRKARPEVIFAPASVDQMVLLGPQLDFYRAGSLVLGLSNFNSAKLRDQSGTVLERAIFPDDLVMFPSRWEEEFQRDWNTETYPPEATALALKAYQATRMLLDTRLQSGATDRRQLAVALDRRLANQDMALDGPGAFGPTMRMFRDERIVAFPSGLFEEAWRLGEGAADSLQAAPADSLPGGSYPPTGDEVNGQG